MGTNPLLANALDLDRWADTLESRGAFPELMRRLLAQTPGVTNIDIRAREGTAAPGWDGTATSDGSSFLPKGELRFEFGTNKDPQAKANKDYNTRAKKVTGKSDEIFVFVTPRNWLNGASWAKKRRQEGVFASVEAYDVHRLEGWLQSTPAVHFWISEQLGKSVSGAQTLTSWWERLRRNCVIEVPTGFHTAGRHQQADKLLDLLATSEKVLSIQAAWRNDTLAFLHAVLCEKRPAELERTMVVSDPEAWRYLAMQSSALILIPLFDNPDIGLALGNGHTVIHPVIVVNESRDDGDIVRLPKIDRQGGFNLLTGAGLDYSLADKRTSLARRSMSAFYRRISLDNERKRPEWAIDRETVSVLAPLILISTWDADHLGDRSEISWFVDLEANKIDSLLDELLEAYPLDPPFIRSGGQWYPVDAMDAAVLLLPKLSEVHRIRWEEFVTRVLLCEDPLEGLSTTDLILAQLRGEHSPVSSDLREHSARGLALAAATYDAVPMRLGSLSNRIDSIVANLLKSAFQDDTGLVLLRLSASLPFLAEASPNVFLKFIETDLSRDEPVAACLFRREKSSFFGWSSSIHDLLAALECLCWNRDNFGRAARLQVKLANLAPDNKDAELCLNSSEKVLVGWAKLSAGDCDDKVAVLKWALEEYSNVGWQLLGKVLLSEQVFLVPYEPVYRDWQVEKGQASEGERGEFVRKVLIEAVRLAEYDADHWLSLLSVLEDVFPHDRLMLSEEFRKAVARSSWNTDELLEVYLFLNGLVGRHQAFAQASWALSAEELQPLVDVMSALEPGDDPRKFAWLFNDRIDISINGLSMSDVGFSDALHEKQAEAIAVVLRGGLDQLRLLVEFVKRPYDVGWLLGESNLADDLYLFAWLEGDSPALREAAYAYFTRVAESRGVEWVCSILKTDSLSLEAKTSFVSALPAGKEYWEIVGQLDQVLVRTYWENVRVILIQEPDRVAGVEHLLEQGCASQAIHLLAWMVSDEQELDVSKVVEALSRLASSSDQIDHPSLSNDVAELLNWLEQEDFENSALPMLEFKYFDYVFDHEPANALYRSLGRDPDGFASLVQSLYSTDDMGMSEESRSLYKKRCWSVLYNWKHLPGLCEDGNIDGSYLAEWIDRVRTLLSVDGNERDYDGQIGEILASSPDGKDGMWPTEEVRDLIESLGNPKMEAGLHRGRVNRTGVTTRGVFEGGMQEAVVAERYRENAREMNARWPRTAEILRALAKDSEQEAARQNFEAEQRGDQD